MNPAVTAWLDSPEGGGYFTLQRNLIRAHDSNCSSLDNVWMPRKGGYDVSAFV